MEEPDEDTRADMIMMVSDLGFPSVFYCCFFFKEKGEARLLHSEEDWVMRLKTVNLILGGARSVSLHQEFLIRSNHANLQLLKIIKVSTFLCYKACSHWSAESVIMRIDTYREPFTIDAN